MTNRGYFGVGIYHTKTQTNVGTLWRSAMNLGADFVFTIGRRYKPQASDTLKTPRHLPLWHFEDFADFRAHIPYDCQVVAVENKPKFVTCPLPHLRHPERAIYLLGAEDHGLSDSVLMRCQAVVDLPCEAGCYNVAVAGALTMYDRKVKAMGLEASLALAKQWQAQTDAKYPWISRLGCPPEQGATLDEITTTPSTDRRADVGGHIHPNQPRSAR
jgi:tRNA(Leu) C34 or U34 (ribose-2'-O)-methylase TrmL